MVQGAQGAEDKIALQGGVKKTINGEQVSLAPISRSLLRMVICGVAADTASVSYVTDHVGSR